MKNNKTLFLFTVVNFLNCISLTAKLSTQELTIISAANDNYEAAVLLGTQLESLALKDANVVSAVRTNFKDVKKFMNDVATKKATGSGAAPASCLTKEQAKDILKIEIPAIKDAADAKVKLVEFFDNGTGSELLKAIGATADEAKSVKTALNNITAK